MRQVAILIKWKMILTWRLYTRNTLASLESILFFLSFVTFVILITAGFAHATNYMLKDGFVVKPLVYCDLFMVIFTSWFLIVLAGYRLNEGYDINRLKLFPCSVNSIFWANTLGAFTDLIVLFPLCSYLAVFFASDPSPNIILPGILLILALLMLQVIAGQAFVALLYVFLPMLDFVKTAMIVIVGVTLWAILLNAGIVGYPMPNFYLFFRPYGLEIFKFYPTGQIALALDSLSGGFNSDALKQTGFFSIWFIGILLFGYALLVLWFNSGKYGYSGVKTVERELSSKLATLGESKFWEAGERILSPLVGEQAYAFFKKDMLALALRSPYFMLYKILPGTIAPVIILLAMHWNLSNVSKLYNTPEIGSGLIAATLALVFFIVIAQANLFAGNLFGLEDREIRNIMVLPTPRRVFLLGKNLFLGGLLFIDALVVSLLLLLYFPIAFAFFASFGLLITMFLIIMGIGNFTSSIWPYWMPLDRPSFTLRSTVILGLVNLGTTILLLIFSAPPLLLVLVPYFYGHELLAWIFIPISVLYGFTFHRLTLGPAMKLAESNEFLILKRVAEREEL